LKIELVLLAEYGVTPKDECSIINFTQKYRQDTIDRSIGSKNKKNPIYY
jgi:hypothetical protein